MFTKMQKIILTLIVVLPVLIFSSFSIGCLSIPGCNQYEKNYQFLYAKAQKYYQQNESSIANRRYITIIDYTLPSYCKRMTITDVVNGSRERFLVTHGHGGKKGNIYAPGFSNIPESFLTPLGFLKTGEEYEGIHGRSLKLHGLEKGLNDKSEERNIVIHKASYASQDAIIENISTEARPRLGESKGCPALDPAVIHSVINRLKDGSLVYIYGKK